MAPATTAMSAHRPTPRIGRIQPRRQMLTMKSRKLAIEISSSRLMAGQLRLDVGVAGAVDEAAGRDGEVVALEPVAGRLHEREQAEQHRQVGLHLRRHPVVLGAHADAAVEVVGDGGDDEHDQQRREQPADEEAQERQLEDVEADVGAELRVLDAEARGCG